MSSRGQLTQYFASTPNLPAINDWMLARARGNKNSRDLNGMISLACDIALQEPLAPDFFNKSALGEWLDNQLCTGIDKVLINQLLEQYYTDYYEGRFDAPGQVFISNPAVEKYKDTEDWKISFSCGLRAIGTLGLEPLLNDSSPCRVPPVEGKTEVDAFKEAVVGTTKGTINAIKDGIIEPAFDAIIPDDPLGKVVLLGLCIGAGFLIFHLYVPKAST